MVHVYYPPDCLSYTRIEHIFVDFVLQSCQLTGYVRVFSRTKSNLVVLQQDKFQYSRTKQDKKFFAAFGKIKVNFPFFDNTEAIFTLLGRTEANLVSVF